MADLRGASSLVPSSVPEATPAAWLPDPLAGPPVAPLPAPHGSALAVPAQRLSPGHFLPTKAVSPLPLTYPQVTPRGGTHYPTALTLPPLRELGLGTEQLIRGPRLPTPPDLL